MKALTIIRCTLPVFLLLSSCLAADSGILGEVDLKSANYQLGAQDLSWHQGKEEVPFTRSYNSRSLFNGMFGFGWCSDFETVLKPEGNDTLVLAECGDGGQFRYLASRTNHQKDPIEWTNPLHGTVRRIDKRLVLTDEKGEITEFAANAQDGRLLSLKPSNGCRLDFKYENGLLREVRACGANWLSLGYSANGKVKEIQTADHQSIRYQTSVDGELLTVTGGELGLCRYKYDDLHNLIHLWQPGKKGATPREADLSYDVDKDWITKFRSGTCEELYTYTVAPRAINRYTSHVKRLCGGEVEEDFQMQFRYGYKKENPALAYLAQSLLIQNTFLRRSITEDIGDPKFDTLLQSRTVNGEMTSFEYDNRGNLLRTRIYDKKGKLSRTESPQGPETSGVNAHNCNFCSSMRDPVTGKTGE